jgi:hypothetical protein
MRRFAAASFAARARAAARLQPRLMVRWGAGLFHGAGRRPQGLRCTHRQTPASALDPAIQALRVAVMPCCVRRVRRRRGVISTLRTGCQPFRLRGWPWAGVGFSKKSLNSLLSSTIGSNRCRLAPSTHSAPRARAGGENDSTLASPRQADSNKHVGNVTVMQRADRRSAGWLCRHGGMRFPACCAAGDRQQAYGGIGCWRGDRRAACGRRGRAAQPVRLST